MNTYSLRLLFFVSCLLILVACQPVVPTSSNPADLTQSTASSTASDVQSQLATLPDIGTIKIGYLPIVAFAPLMVADAKGYFAEQGLNVELVPFQAGSFMVAPLSIGELDAALPIELSAGLFNAIANELDIRIVGSHTIFDEETPIYLLVRKDLFDSGEITKISDMLGHKVSIPGPRGLAEFAVASALANAGLSIDDVELVTLPFPEAPGALANEAIDLAYLADPLATKAQRDGTATVLLPVGQMIGHDIQMTGVMLGRRLLEPANREIAVRVLMAFFKAVRNDLVGDYNQNPEIISILEKYTKLPTAVVQSINPYTMVRDGTMQEAGIMEMQKYFIDRQYLEYSELLPLEKIIDPSFTQEAIKRLEQAGE
ncbi:MAG: ABC transporter substrate-binding protein [Caldilineaceae bacterium]|nr:ABC transporter substrate-binding protein [Caldilineaceae bacterium]